MSPDTDNKSWVEWSQYVLRELERLNRCYESLDDRIRKINDNVTILNVKATMMGAVGGAVAGVICSVIGAFFISVINGH